MKYQVLVTTVLFTAIRTVSASTTLSDSDFSLGIPEVITRCEAPAEIGESLHYVNVTMPGQQVKVEQALLTLIKQGGNYDVLIGQESIGNGKTLINAASGYNTVHLVINDDTGIEHFLFDLNLDGSGELLWSSATVSALTTCVADLGL